MSVTGEPIRGRHGVILYSAQSVQGTAVPPAVAAGIASWDVTVDGDLRPIYTLGRAEPLLLKPGIAKTDFTVSIEAVQTVALLTKTQRTSGCVPWLTFGFGYKLDDGTKEAKQVQDCKINQVQIDLEPGGLLRAQLTGTGGLVTDLTSLNPADLAEAPFMSYEAVFTKGGSAYKLKSFSMSVDHGIAVESCIPGSAPSAFKRGWTHQTEGQLAITGELTRYAKSGVDLHGDTLSSFALQLACTDISGGGNTATIALTGAKFGSEKMSLSPDGDYVATTPFIATGYSIS